jgi:hypothetical protein
MSKESLAVPLRATRSETIAAVGSLFNISRVRFHAPEKPCGRPPRKQTYPGSIARRVSPWLGADLTNFDRRTSQTCRSAAVDCFYLRFAPASSEQAFCSLKCDASQVVTDCVSEADIFLLMQEQ